ncbi:lipase maturation factor family protein [Arthrobacter rhombi]|uniref:lipase maturation factor family protein n=1 Tax=Arthrobacter rhombi TaxID=71253 RepID=UPI003FD68615
MDWLQAPDYWVAREILQRGVAAVFLIAFASTLNQFRALLGERGLLPADRLLAGPGARGPTLFTRWGYSDAKLVAVCWVGLVVAGALVLGLPQAGPAWLPLLAFLVLWGLYQSMVNIGGIFYGFGWEMLLLEAGFTVGFLGSHQVEPPRTILILIAWLVFRLEFGAGMIKWRGDPAWRNLTALYYHHETQPMPGPLSRRAHLAPWWWHRCEVAGNHVAQLAVPFLLFIPQPVASIAAGLIIFTQLWLVATGNFAWLNWITIVLACCAVNDRAFAAVASIIPGVPAGAVAYHPEVGAGPAAWIVLVLLATGVLAVAGFPALLNFFSRSQLMNASFNRWQLGNAYGAFGSVTRQRVEVVIEGEIDGETGWHEYEFRGKPGDPSRRPRQFAPYHLRLDWMMWFLPLGSLHQRWFHALLLKLLAADPAILALLRVDPFAGRAPDRVRVLTYNYRFATRSEKKEQHVHWVRSDRRLAIGPVQRG